MKKSVLNLKNKTVGDIDLDEKVFCVKKFPDLIHQYIRYQNAKSRQGSHKTKSRSEVKGRSKKPFSQKGTGNARHASRKAPIFVGGGVAHGPKGESKYKLRKLNKSEKKLSVISILTIKNKSKDLIVLDDFNKDVFKTKEMSKILKKLDADNSLMIFDKNSRNKIIRSVKNIPNVKLTDINHFSSFDLIKYKKIILTETSVKEIEKRYS